MDMKFLIKGVGYEPDNFNATEYYNNGGQVELKAVGFSFSLNDLRKIKEKFDEIKEVKSMNYDYINQVLTIGF